MSFVSGAWHYFDDGLIKQYDKPVANKIDQWTDLLSGNPLPDASRLNKWTDLDPKEKIINPIEKHSAIFCMAATTGHKHSRFTGLILLEGVKNLHLSRLEDILGDKIEMFVAEDDFDLYDHMIDIDVVCDE